jgi:hypothetical protein
MSRNCVSVRGTGASESGLGSDLLRVDEKFTSPHHSVSIAPGPSLHCTAAERAQWIERYQRSGSEKDGCNSCCCEHPHTSRGLRRNGSSNAARLA